MIGSKNGTAELLALAWLAASAGFGAGCSVDDRQVSALQSPVSPNATLNVPTQTLNVGNQLATSSTNFDFGSVAVGSSVSGALLVNNGGDRPLKVDARIDAQTQDEFTAVLSGECAQLARAASCSVNLRFTPLGPGDRSAQLVLSAADVILARVQLLGRGAMPDPAGGGTGGSGGASTPGSAGNGGTLSTSTGLVTDVPDLAFSGQELGTQSAAQSVTVSNRTGSDLGALSISLSDTADYSFSTTCAGGLAAGASCDISVQFAPSFLGAAVSSLLISQGPYRATVAVSGRGQYRLSVVRAGAGSGTVTGPPGMDCGPTCSVLLDPGFTILSAHTENGSDSFFSSWSVGDCSDPTRDCGFTLSASQTVTASFSAQTNNLVFLSSEDFPPTYGADAADERCNALATTAGINNAAGNAFVAAVSGSSSFWNRIPMNVRGWVRMDGLPFGDQRERMLADPPEVYYSVQFNEIGGRASAGVWTGTAHDGTLASNCSNWTSILDGVTGVTGDAAWLPGWLETGTLPCNLYQDQGLTLREGVYCLGTTKTAPIALPPFAGKRIWLTNTLYQVGSMTPDAKCQAERPAGVTSSKALIAYTGHPVAELLDAAATYVTPDGELVGTGAQIANGQMAAAPWIAADGSRVARDRVWTGQRQDAVPTDAHTCADWRSATGTAVLSLTGSVDLRAFDGIVDLPVCNSITGRLYCIEP